METIHVRVNGVPKGQPRARAFAMNGKARLYDPGTAEGWKNLIAMELVGRMPERPHGTELDGRGERVPVPVAVSVEFLFPRPKRLCRKCDPVGRIPYLAKPDRDNLDKAVLDALVAMGFLADDAMVFDGHLTKWYVAKGEEPGAIISISIFGKDDVA